MSNAADVDTKELIWSTWEELLLAFAVKRHGLKDWDTVAMELQNRHRHRSSSSLPPTLFTAQICRNKFKNLRRRFTNNNHRAASSNTTVTAGGGAGDVGGARESENNELPCEAQSEDDDDENDGLGGGGGGGGGGEGDCFPWLEELRKLRVAELKQEVHRYDLSIRSLQMKVKTMEEEREKSLKEDDDQNDDVKKPDLEEEVKQERSENDKNDDKDLPEMVAGKFPSGEHDENMSFNESNSTVSKRAGLKSEPKNEPAEVRPESDSKPVGEEVSCNDSSASQERAKGGGDSGELRDSVGEEESKEATKESSDMQSSASLLTRKRKRRGVDGGGDGAAVLSPSTAPIKREGGVGGAVKSEPSAFGLLDKIRSHEHGSVFERRLESQKTEKYKSTIRRHVDLETVQARIDDGSYTSCFMKFYEDLLLLFTNAIVFFPKSSPESLAATELRQLVQKELNDNNSPDPSPQPASVKPKPKPEVERSDSLLAQHKSTNPIIFSRKRSSISAKASSSSANNNVEKQRTNEKPVINSKTPIKSPLSTSNDEEDSSKLKLKEKPVTGVRSMRRSSKGRPNVSKPEPAPNSSNNKSSGSHQPGSKDKGDKAEAAKVDRKKSEATASTKKSGAADFLKRMKKNSPAKGTLVEALKSSRDSNTNKGGKKDQPKKKVDERKDGPVRRSGGGGGGGGGSRKNAKEESSPSKRNAGRPPKKGKDAVVTGVKRGREGGVGEGSSKRPKKRSR